MTQTLPRVVIVGGGLAGLAAAAALGERGVSVTVLESRPRLGGRASSFHDVTTDSWIDNCQHVTMGCCTNFQHFCEQTGLAGFFRDEPALYFVGPHRRIHRFAAGSWPAPLHLVRAFAGLSYLTWADKLALARGLRALARHSADEAGMDFAAWLQRHRQSPNAVRYFWQVVLVSALSESLDRIAVPAARKVLVDGFLTHRDAWRMRVPTVPLEELYGGPLIAWMQGRGIELRLLSAADELIATETRISGVRLRSGAVIDGDEFVAAVPFHRVRSLLPAPWKEIPEVEQAERLESSPISSVHLWFDSAVMDLPHAVFVDGLVQWIFNRTVLASRERQRPESSSTTSDSMQDSGRLSSRLAGEAHYYQVVISASREVVERDSTTVLQQVLDELAAVWPAVKVARLLHSRQVTEHRAVFSPRPGSDALRPPQQSPLRNLQFAGDWTRTGWPATMEGAVRSGYLAAENVLARLGRPARLLQPDLPPSPLFRWLFGERQDSAANRTDAAASMGAGGTVVARE